MGIKKRDWIYLGIVMVIMMVTNCTIEDPRAMIPPEPSAVEKAVKEVNKHVHDVQYMMAKAEEESVEEEPIEEPIEVIEEDTDPAYTEEYEEYYEESEFENCEINADESHDEEPYEISDEETYEESYEQGLIYLGSYEITAYEYTGSRCANGNYPTPWYTVASNYFDFGTTLYIDGVGYVVVEDRGASWHGDNWLDIYIGDIDACYEWGRQYRDVYIVG